MRPGYLIADGTASDLDELLTALGSALSPGFTVSRTGSHHDITRVWLDTYDWQLYRAGITLEHAAGELRAGTIVQRVPRWRPALHGAVTLPPGPVADAIAPLIEPRRLVRVAQATATTASLALLNDDQKTVVRLAAEWPRNARPRITLTEIRGYPAQARRAAALLTEAFPGMEPAQGTLLEEVATRRPGGYTGRIDARIDPGQPATAAIAVVLLNLLDTLETNVDGVLRDIDIEFLHDLRVAVRRTRSALKLLRTRLPIADLPHFTAEFKWLGDVTTPVRDLDVHLLEFDETAARLSAGHPQDLLPVRDYLVRRRATELRRLTRQLKSSRFQTLVTAWRKALTTQLGKPRRRGPDAHTVAVATARAARRKLLTRGNAITDSSAPEALHDLRKRAKELRYALEFFAAVYPRDEYDAVLSDLKKLQDCLGEYQDTHVQIEEIKQQAADMLADREHPVQAPTLLAMGELIAGLGARQRAARADFARRFAVFAGPAGTRRFERLLGDSE